MQTNIVKPPPIFGFQPRPWQANAIARQKQTTVMLVSRRGGKTALCAYLAGSAFLSVETQIDVCLASFALNNAREVLWSQLIGLLSPLPPHIEHSKSRNVLTNKRTGSTVRLFGLSNEHGDKIRGFSFNLAILDEFPKIPYGIYNEAFLPTLLDRDGFQILIGTPSGSYDLISELHQECMQPENAETHEFIQYPASQLIGQIPHLTAAKLAKIKKRNPLVYAREYEVSLTASASDTIFDVELLTHAATQNSPILADSSPVHAGLDFAVRKDACVLAIRNSLNFIAFIKLEYNKDPWGFVRTISNLVHQYKIRFLTIDRGGCGEVLSDLLETQLSGRWPCEACEGVIAGERPYHDSNFNLRAELYSLLRDYMANHPNTCSIELEHRQMLFNELSAITQKPNDRGVFQVISKDVIVQKIGHSPDFASAASLSMYFDRDSEGWSIPAEELTSKELNEMSTEEILATFPELYEPEYGAEQYGGHLG